MADIKIGSKYFVDDYDFVFQQIDITTPEPITMTIPIPGTSTQIDLSQALSGEIEFNRRTMTIEGQAVDGVKRWAANYSIFANDVHGRVLNVEYSNDPGFYWTGRVTVKKFSDKPTGADIMVSVDCDPYKLEKLDSSAAWIWDDVNFEVGIVRYYRRITVPGGVYIPGRRKPVCPVFECTADIQVYWRGKFYSLPTGFSQIADIYLGEGDNWLGFYGAGRVTVYYQGGSL